MTLFVPDVNVLVYAFRADSSDHDVYADWLNGALRTDRIGVADTTLNGFMRVVTHSRIFTEPTPPKAALAFVRHLVDAPTTEWLRQGASAWEKFDLLASADGAVRGNLVPDAHHRRALPRQRRAPGDAGPRVRSVPGPQMVRSCAGGSKDPQNTLSSRDALRRPHPPHMDTSPHRAGPSPAIRCVL